MTVAAAFVAELDMESHATRRVLERVPEAHLTWRPHEKSSSLGQLALHVALLPQQLAAFVAPDRLDFTRVDTHQPAPQSHAAIVAAFEESLRTARAYLTALDDVRAGQTWTLCAGSTELFAAPRASVIRSFLFNHLYHHRGQLLVHLRLLNVPLPSVYGPSADENPFAGALSQGMAYDEGLAVRLRRLLGRRAGITEREMFGGLAFLRDGRMCCGIVGSDLVVRVMDEEIDAVLTRKHVRPMDFTGRPMRGFVYVAPAACSTAAVLRAWVSRGLRYVDDASRASPTSKGRATRVSGGRTTGRRT